MYHEIDERTIASLLCSAANQLAEHSCHPAVDEEGVHEARASSPMSSSSLQLTQNFKFQDDSFKQRVGRDEFRRLVDCSMARLYPPLDVEQYEVSFHSNVATLWILPAGGTLPHLPISYQVEGEVIEGDEEPPQLEQDSPLALIRKRNKKEAKLAIHRAKLAVEYLFSSASSLHFVTYRGVQLNMVVVGWDERSVYLGLPADKGNLSQCFYLVGKAALPFSHSGVASVLQHYKAGERNALPPPHIKVMHQRCMDVAKKRRSTVLYPTDPKWMKENLLCVTSIAHRFYLGPSGGTPHVEVEDLFIVGAIKVIPNGISPVSSEPILNTTVAGLCGIIRDAQAAQPSEADIRADGAMWQLCEALKSTNVPFPHSLSTGRESTAVPPLSLWKERSRKAGASQVVETVSKGHLVAEDESKTVEFKQAVADWEDLQGQQSGNKKLSMSTERIRETLVALANSNGGYVLIGVKDNGLVVGAAIDDASLRLTGFCPAMHTNCVVMRKLPLVDMAKTSAALSGQWWKNPGAAPPQQQGATAQQQQAPQYVAIVRVEKGNAPFYLTSGRFDKCWPKVRGCASTVSMSTRTLVFRVAQWFYGRGEHAPPSDGPEVQQGGPTKVGGKRVHSTSTAGE